MNLYKAFSLISACVYLAACTPNGLSLPASPAQAKDQATALTKQMTEFGEQVQDKADMATTTVERLGDTVVNSAQYVGSKLESLGNTVLEVTGSEAPAQQP